jgi:hypothetical protein
MRLMDAKKTNMAVTSVIGLIVVGAIISWLLPPDIIEVGMDSSHSGDEKRGLFVKYAHETSYPESASEVCFRLEPGFFENGDVYGEYVRFKASEEEIQQFVESTLGLDSKREVPTDYASWHQGVGNYEWWRPMAVADPVYYEDGRKFITVDSTNGIVYYSYVRSYSDVKGISAYGN